jgi:hypothetical protein
VVKIKPKQALGLVGDYEADGEILNGGVRYTRVAGTGHVAGGGGAASASASAAYLFRSAAGRWAFAHELADVAASKRLLAMSSGGLAAASPVGLQYKYLDPATYSWRLDPTFKVADASAAFAARRSRSAGQGKVQADAARRLEAERSAALAEEAASRGAARAEGAAASARAAVERAALEAVQEARAADAADEAADVVAVVEALRREREEKVQGIRTQALSRQKP